VKIYLKERDWFAGRYSGYKFSVGWKYIVLVRKPIKHILKKKKKKKRDPIHRPQIVFLLDTAYQMQSINGPFKLICFVIVLIYVLNYLIHGKSDQEIVMHVAP
jgi:hypothetical protein